MTDNKYIGVKGLEELINLTKNSLAKKADTFQFDVMPDPVKYIGKVVQYVGISDASYTRSHFYYSDGTRWTEETISDEQTIMVKIVYALPDWISADSNILYILKGATDNTMSLYVKNASVNGAWFTVESGGSFAIVDSLPQWSDANASTIYFKANGDALAGYIKNTGTINAWYTLGGATQEIDTALSSVSTNPVQNKVVYAAIQDVHAAIQDAIQDVLAQVASIYPKPDWAGAVTITEAQFKAGFAAPSDGMFVGICGKPLNSGSSLITVNNVEVANTVHAKNDLYYDDSSISLVVAKGDIIKSSTTDTLVHYTMSFVPWK